MILIDTYWYSSKCALSTQDARKLIFEKNGHLQPLAAARVAPRDRKRPLLPKSSHPAPIHTLWLGFAELAKRLPRILSWSAQWKPQCSWHGSHHWSCFRLDSTDSRNSVGAFMAITWPWSPWCFTQTNSCGKLTHSLSGMSQKVRSYDTYPNVVIIPRLSTLDCWLYLPRSCFLFISGCSKYRIFSTAYFKNHLNVEKIYHTCRLNC